MKSNKEYRFINNPKEKEFHDKFLKMFKNDSSNLSSIIFGLREVSNSPIKYLTEEEEDICLNLIQWLGSPVGQNFLNDCGFVEKNNAK